MPTYSQNAEDAVVLSHVLGIEDRCVLEIGAGHPKELSNSLVFIEEGWEAVLIEPSPVLFKALLDFHFSNGKVKLIHAAVGAERRMVPFFEASDPFYSTTRPEIAEKWKQNGMSYHTYWVPQVTVKDLVHELGIGAGVLSIDTEGTSFDILTQCPLIEWNTKAIIIEHDGRIVELCAWGNANGYDPKRVNSENIVFLKG